MPSLTKELGEHEFSARAKGVNFGWREVEPLALLLLGSETVLPILFEDVRTVCSYFVLRNEVFGKQETYSSSPLFWIVRFANFIQAQ